MDLISIFFVAVALAMDAFAVSLATSLALNPVTGGQVFRFSFHFGLFQAMMPVIGWMAGTAVYEYISAVDHWIAFGLLAFVGGKMIYEALSPEKSERTASDPTRGWDLIVLSVATSIDALAVGLSISMLGGTILLPAVIIGLVAAALTVVGMMLGGKIGGMWGKKVEVIGGLVLITIGIRIVVEHLFFA
ncbi:MAG: manganese efflux pump [Deltaproteobacteria bacterium]|nr:manganese efflux pump [Candidatus Zymogenaceae bacterium]